MSHCGMMHESGGSGVFAPLDRLEPSPEAPAFGEVRSFR